MPKPLPTRGAPLKLPETPTPTGASTRPLPTRGAPATLKQAAPPTPVPTTAPVAAPTSAPVSAADASRSRAPVNPVNLFTYVGAAIIMAALLITLGAPPFLALLLASVPVCGAYVMRSLTRDLLRPVRSSTRTSTPTAAPAGPSVTLRAPLSAAEQAMFSQTGTYLTAALADNRAQGDSRRAYESSAALTTTLPELRRSYAALPRAQRDPEQLGAALRAMMQASAPDDSRARRDWDTQMRYISQKYGADRSGDLTIHPAATLISVDPSDPQPQWRAPHEPESARPGTPDTLGTPGTAAQDTNAGGDTGSSAGSSDSGG